MTKDVKLAISAAVAMLVAFAIMAQFHSYGPHPSFIHLGFQKGHPMMALGIEMGWLMAVGPLAMILFFGGVLTLAVLWLRYLAKIN